MTIKEMRMQAGFSQSQFAKYLNIPLFDIQNWEQGRRNPPIYVINMIYRILLLEGVLSDGKEINN